MHCILIARSFFENEKVGRESAIGCY